MAKKIKYSTFKGDKVSKKKVEFTFEGYDSDGDPIVKDGSGKIILPETYTPSVTDDDLEQAIYCTNPTWVKIGGKWYKIG